MLKLFLFAFAQACQRHYNILFKLFLLLGLPFAKGVYLDFLGRPLLFFGLEAPNLTKPEPFCV